MADKGISQEQGCFVHKSRLNAHTIIGTGYRPARSHSLVGLEKNRLTSRFFLCLVILGGAKDKEVAVRSEDWQYHEGNLREKNGSPRSARIDERGARVTEWARRLGLGLPLGLAIITKSSLASQNGFPPRGNDEAGLECRAREVIRVEARNAS